MCTIHSLGKAECTDPSGTQQVIQKLSVTKRRHVGHEELQSRARSNERHLDNAGSFKCEKGGRPRSISLLTRSVCLRKRKIKKSSFDALRAVGGVVWLKEMDSGVTAMEDCSCRPRDCAWRAQVRFWVARSLQITIWSVVFVHLGGLVALGVGVGVHAVSIGTFEVTHCARCEGLKYCTAMNGKLYFDPVNGYTREATTQLEKQGVCEDLDAKTLELSSFGDQFQFKDTEACHTLVWNYHCLSWVAATFQRAVDGVNVSCATATDDAPIPLPPCRSLRVEVADKCVYSHFYRMYLENVCGNVPCVSEEEELVTAKTSSPKKQADCIKAPWESAPNTTFSRCSIREYVVPKASARRLSPSQLSPMLLCLQTAVWLYSNFC